MHHGVFCGSLASMRETRILILGESHHISTKKESENNKEHGKPATYPTYSVIEEYLEDIDKKEKNLRFFEKIAKTFGAYSSLQDEREKFWEQVYFGNYIEELCDIQTGFARRQVKEKSINYNQNLFEFVNQHEIDKIFCFSILSYNNLPSAEISRKDEIGKRGNRRVYLRQCTYKAGVVRENLPSLKKDLIVYGISHPSARGGYALEAYTEALKNQF